MGLFSKCHICTSSTFCDSEAALEVINHSTAVIHCPDSYTGYKYSEIKVEPNPPHPKDLNDFSMLAIKMDFQLKLNLLLIDIGWFR